MLGADYGRFYSKDTNRAMSLQPRRQIMGELSQPTQGTFPKVNMPKRTVDFEAPGPQVETFSFPT